MSIYYSPAPLLSQKCIFNYVIGNRGGGKSFSGKELAIKRFKKKGKQFIYLRRYQTELDPITDYFADIRFKFPTDVLEQKVDKLYINGELAGYMVALSKTPSLKSSSDSNVSAIVSPISLKLVSTLSVVANTGFPPSFNPLIVSDKPFDRTNLPLSLPVNTSGSTSFLVAYDSNAVLRAVVISALAASISSANWVVVA